MQRESKEELTRRGRERQRMLILGNLLDMDFSLEESAMIVGLSMKEIYVLMVLDIMEIEDWKIKEEAMKKENIDLFNQRLEELCNQRGIPFLDSSYILNLESDPYSPDGIHPKGFYYEKWALDILNKMR